MDFRRLRMVFKYGWKDAAVISQETGRNRVGLFTDILSCFLNYFVYSNQYRKEKLYNIKGEERKNICLKLQKENIKRVQWLDEFYDNYKFLNKWSSLKYEQSPDLQKKKWAAYTKRYGFGKNCVIGHDVLLVRHHHLDGTISVGNNLLMAKHTFIDYSGFVEIGDNVSLSDSVMIESHEHLNHRDPSKDKKKEIKQSILKIERGAFCGSRSIILGSCHSIGRFARIGANSVVAQDVPPYAVVQGNPAKIVGFIYNEEQILQFESHYIPEEERLTKEEIGVILKKYKIAEFPQNTYQQSVSEDSVIEKVRNIVSSVLGYHLDPDYDQTSIDEIDGWGSLANITIISELEALFNCRFTSDDLFDMTSLEAISKVISEKKESVTSFFQINKGIKQLYPHSPLWQGICENVENNPLKIAIKSGSGRLTYVDFYENTCKAAYYLNNLGIRKGDCVLLSAQKRFEFVFFYFASHILGSINVILDQESNEERKKLIEDAVKPKICIGHKSDRFKCIDYEDIDLKHVPALQAINDVDLSHDDITEIMFTTGTTSLPKGVCLSFGNIFGSTNNINDYIGNNGNDIELIGLPICHSFAMGRLRCNLLKGATVVFIENFGNVHKFFKILEEEKCTGFAMVPAVWEYLKKMSGERISRFARQLKFIEIGSASMPIESKKNLVKLLPDTRICMHYGLTEASRSLFIEFHDNMHLNTIGKPVSAEVDVKILNPNGVEQEVGEIGEICVKGNMVMSRYLNPEDNKNAFHNQYFRTGDLGYKDVEGYIILIGRKKEIINVGGKKVSPQEVEDAIISLGVGDCVCVPMNDPDGVMGELVKCFVLKESTELSFDEIANGLQNLLEPYKRPVSYEWIDSIPKTESGKKQRLQIIVKKA